MTAGRLDRRTKILYGAGDTSFSLSTTIVGAYFAIFLTDVVGVAPAVAAAAIFLGRTWDYVNDPLIGYLSDRTRSRWGRRRPYLLFASVPYGAAFAMMWYRPPIATSLGLSVYYSAAYILLDTAATFAYMPYVALTPELAADYDERTSLTGYRMFFSIAASLVAFTLPIMLVGSFRPQNAPRVLRMGALFGLAIVIPLLLTFAGTRERDEYQRQEPPRFFRSLRAAFTNRPFLISIGIFLLTWVSIDILQTTLLYFIKYVALREAQSDLIMASIFVTAALSLPLWNGVSRRLDKRLAYMAGIGFWALVQVLLILLGGGTPMVLLLLLCVLAGIGVGAAHILTWAIMPDAVEWDELKSGRRHEGMFYSLMTLMQKVAVSIAIPLALLLLDRTGYVPNAEVQPRSVLIALRVLVGPVPALFLCGAILLAAFYPIDRLKFADIRRRIGERKRGPGAPDG